MNKDYENLEEIIDLCKEEWGAEENKKYYVLEIIHKETWKI